MPAPLHVLLVDDQTDNRHALRWVLHRAFGDAVILEAPTQEEAERISQSESMDCIVLDASVANFESVCSLLSQHAENCRVPLIMVGDICNGSQREFGLQLGLDRWIDKDEMSVTRLRATVKEALREADFHRLIHEQGLEVARLKAELERMPPEMNEAALEAALGKVVSDAPLPAAPIEPANGASGLAAPAVVTNAEPSSFTVESPVRSTSRSIPTRGEPPTPEELETARQLQAELLPDGSPFIEGFEIAGLSLSAQSTGGDYYDYLPTSEGLLNITIGECSGQGLAPTMLITSLRAYLRVLSAAMNDPSDIVSHANKLITEDIGDEEFLITLMLVQIDQLTRRINYASAGHQGYLFNRDGEVQILHSTGMPMGLLADTIIPEGTSMKLRANEILLLVTDGAQKMTSESGERFGVTRMLDFVRAHRHLPVRMIITLLRDACVQFAGANGLTDDITFVLVRAEASSN